VLGSEGFAQDVFARVLDALDETLWSVALEPGPRFRFVTLSGAITHLPGGDRDSLIGHYVDEMVSAEALVSANEALMRAVDTGIEQHFEIKYDGAQGRRVLLNTVFPGDDRSILTGISRDVTAERANLERIGRRDAMNRGVLDAIPAATAVIDDTGIVRFINAAWLSDAADLGREVGLPGDDLLPMLHRIEGADIGVRLVLDGDRPVYEVDYLDGGRWLNLRVVPFDLNGARGAVISRTDVTHRVNQQQLIEMLNQRWQLAFATAPIGMALSDANGQIILVNPKLCEQLAVTEDEALQLQLFDLTLPEDRPPESELVGRGNVGMEVRLRRPNGTWFWAMVTWSALGDAFDKPHYFVQLQDISARKRAEARLADHHELLELVASGAALDEVLARVAAVGELRLPGTHWIVAASSAYGLSEQVTAVGVDPSQSAALDEAYRTFAPSRWRDAPGIVIIPKDGGSPLGAALGVGGSWAVPIITERDVVSGFVVVHRPPEDADPEDLTLVEQLCSIVRIAVERDAATRRLAEHLLEDSLTGLPSRTLFHRRLEQAVGRIGHGSRGIAVITADLDRFGRINESLGHVAGDDVLVQVAARLRAALPGPDTVARGGGDEFLVLVEDVADAGAARAIAEKLLAEVRHPVQVGDVEFVVPASAGVVFTATVDDSGALESNASLAMAAAKARGRDRVELYDATLRHAMPRLSLERELAHAIARKEFVVHFQPEVALDSNTVVGVEALVRWAHPERGLLQPADFIVVAEECGAIVEIGREVLTQACARLAEWAPLTDAPLTVSVNVSARQFADPGLIAFTAATLERFDIAPHRLVFEMTERTLVDDDERTTAVFHALRDLGVQVTIDDFGTGYSSLRYLKRFPADAVKIDRSFVAGLGDDPDDSAIVAAVVHLSHRLDLTVIAEGVETAEQLAYLRRLGCDAAQGFLWSAPLSADEMTDFLRAPLAEIPHVPVVALESINTERHELDELLAVLTHELSTPLTVIGGYAEMLADRLDEDANARSGVAAIERNVHNLGQLVAALADARDLGTVGETVRFDATPLLEQTLGELLPLLTDHRVSCSLPNRPVVVDADPVGLRQVLGNLVGNAGKFTPHDGRIEIVAGTCNRWLEVRVIDHGEGVPADRVDELFGRFSRLGSTRRGLGLGLYLARSIARRQRGDVRYEPTPGGGATFVVTVPLAQQPEET